jgi:hypothetical protein
MAPGLASLVVAAGVGAPILLSGRMSSSIPRFRRQKRAAKSLIDVAFDRLGEALAAAWSGLRWCSCPPSSHPRFFGSLSSAP